MKNKLKILITNDDGFFSKGIKELCRLMAPYGDIVVVAPSEAQSGKSAALSLCTHLYLKEESIEPGLKVYSFSGTPIDCVKLGINEFYSDGLPDLLVSGINHGTNSSIASIYSGTLGACMEGTVYGIPSIGFSLDSHDEDADFDSTIHFGRMIIDKYLSEPFSKGIYLNVNVPNLPIEKVKGIKIARRGQGIWLDEYVKKIDPQGNDSYWMEGYFKNLEDGNSIGDHMLMHEGYVTIVPHKIDNTDYEEMENIRDKWDIE